MIYALSHLSGNTNEKRDSELIKCLEHLHIAFQCKDDIDDFLFDLENEQHTYAHILAYITFEKESSQKYTGSKDFLHRYFYVSGQAEYLLKKSLTEFDKAYKIAEYYNLVDFQLFLDEEKSLAKAQIYEIQLLIEKTKTKASLSFQSKKDIIRLRDTSLTESINLGMGFLQNDLSNNQFLSDFITTAGIGKQWISNYAAFTLSGYRESTEIIKSLSNCYINKPKYGSFNERIVQDSDSLAFRIGATQKILDNVNNNDIIRLAKYQSANGGWKTFMDDKTLRKQISLDKKISFKGWTSEHNCVSASICYILSLIPSKKDSFYKTADFLLKQLDKNGRLNSYWWSSPIYATSWMIIAFSQEEILKKDCIASVNWLVSQQKKSGGWSNYLLNEDSFFYTSMAVEALSVFDIKKYNYQINRGINFLLNNQKSDGSWLSGRILSIPQTDIINKDEIKKWRKSSFGVNILVDDHKRIFTTVTVLKTLLYQVDKK